MTFEEYYGPAYQELQKTRSALDKIAEQMQAAGNSGEDLQQIVYFCSRIKKPDSMIRKLKARGFPTNVASALENAYDAVGLRIVCSFTSDVISVVESLEHCPAITVCKKKDYLLYPKPNGYRSVHLCVRLEETGMLAEIQVRTIAMDFWATLEHQLKYKKSVADESLIRRELKRCADEIASTDLSMQTIREILKEPQEF